MGHGHEHDDDVVRERFLRGQELSGEGELDEAAEEFLWLWDHAVEHDPSWVGVRSSFLVAALGDLVPESEVARRGVAQRRDAAEAALRGAPAGAAALADWLDLNAMLGEVERSVTWFVRAAPALPPELRGAVELQLAHPLAERGLWRERAWLYPEPLAWLEAQHESVQEMLAQAAAREARDPSDARVAAIRAHAHGHFRGTVARLVRSLRAAGREAELAQVLARAQEVDPSPEMVAALEG